MVKKLFWEDPLMEECTATVTSLTKDSEESYHVELDQTIFFAFSGGQASDYGTINGLSVTNANKQGERIIYSLNSTPNFKVGDQVTVKIDLNRRKKLMRLHSAAHFVGFLFEELTGIEPSSAIGSSVDPNKARLDYKYPQNISHIFPELEKRANEMFTSDNPVKTYASSEDPNRRVWESGTYSCPCGGTHVTNSNKIGKVRLKRKNTGSGKERIEILLLDQ